MVPDHPARAARRRDFSRGRPHRERSRRIFESRELLPRRRIAGALSGRGRRGLVARVSLATPARSRRDAARPAGLESRRLPGVARPQDKHRLAALNAWDGAALIGSSIGARWAFTHGMWAFGVDSLSELIPAGRAYHLRGAAERIACPPLVCEAEQDPFWQGQPQQLYDALTCPKSYLRCSTIAHLTGSTTYFGRAANAAETRITGRLDPPQPFQLTVRITRPAGPISCARPAPRMDPRNTAFRAPPRGRGTP